MSGEASPADAETLLDQLHLLFRAPVRLEEAKLATTMAMLREHVHNAWRDPHRVFDARARAFNAIHAAGDGSGGGGGGGGAAGSFFRRVALRDVEQIDARWAVDFFEAHFRNPAAFTLVFVGNIGAATLRPLLESHLASLPPGGAPPLARADVMRLRVLFPREAAASAATRRLCCVLPMVEQECTARVTFPIALGARHGGTLAERLRDSVRLEHLVRLLEAQLTDRLRLQLGQLYDVSVDCSWDNSASWDNRASGPAAPGDDPADDPEVQGGQPPLPPPPPPSPPPPQQQQQQQQQQQRRGEGYMQGLLTVYFSCQPAQVTELSAVVVAEVRGVRERALGEDMVTAEIQATRRGHEELVRRNGYWRDAIFSAYTSPRYAGDVQATWREHEAARRAALGALSPAAARDWFRALFDDDDARCYTVATLVPADRRAARARLAVGGAAAVALLALALRRQK